MLVRGFQRVKNVAINTLKKEYDLTNLEKNDDFILGFYMAKEMGCFYSKQSWQKGSTLYEMFF